MARKDDDDSKFKPPITGDDEMSIEENKPTRSLFGKESQQSQQDVQVRVVSENELLHLRLNEISAKLDEILKIARQ